MGDLSPAAACLFFMFDILFMFVCFLVFFFFKVLFLSKHICLTYGPATGYLFFVCLWLFMLVTLARLSLYV